MKYHQLTRFLCLGLSTLALAVPVSLARADGLPSAAADANVKKIADAQAFYQTFQFHPDTVIPDSVVAGSKGVLFIHCWTGSAGIGALGGCGIGLAKDASGKFSAPAFYTVGGLSLGLQLGVKSSKLAIFLMTDRAKHVLTDGKWVGSGELRAVAGDKSSTRSSRDGEPDVIIFQQSSGLDLGAAVAASKVNLDNDSNRAFYGKPDLTPSGIFEGKVDMPEAAKPLLTLLNKQTETK